MTCLPMLPLCRGDRACRFECTGPPWWGRCIRQLCICRLSMPAILSSTTQADLAVAVPVDREAQVVERGRADQAGAQDGPEGAEGHRGRKDRKHWSRKLR